MILTVIRHGMAEEHAEGDSDRSLTKEGRDEVRQAATALAGTDPSPDLIVSSPYVRAVQTAELVAAAAGYGGAIRVSRALEPEAPPSGVRDLVEGFSERAHIVLVAHEPLLSGVCRLLLGTRFSGIRRAEMVSMGFVPGVSGGPASAKLRWRVDSGVQRGANRL